MITLDFCNQMRNTPEMSHYTKLWSQILESTIWQEPNDMLVLWIAILALKDKDHVVHGTIPGLASRAKISNDECAQFIARMEGPDKWSGNQEHEGRRLKKVDGGWLVLNGEKYQEFMRAEHRREAVAKAVARCRAKKKKPKPKTPYEELMKHPDHPGTYPIPNGSPRLDPTRQASPEVPE